MAKIKRRRARTVLVVDDDDQARELLRRRLEPEGYQVIEAADGAAALDLYRREPADVVLTDMRMPAMGGGELIRALNMADRAVRIIAMSGDPGEAADLLREAKDLGVLTLQKPFTTAQLLEIVQKALRKRRKRSA